MLKNIDPLLGPDLLKYLDEMGHGDLLAIVDRNFPAHSTGRRVVELPMTSFVDAAKAILSVLPVDSYIDPAIIHMLADDGTESPATAMGREIWNAAEGRQVPDQGVFRHGWQNPEGEPGFYARSREAYLTVRTGETIPYACFLIAKGTV
jgi:L-fucose mutarotase